MAAKKRKAAQKKPLQQPTMSIDAAAKRLGIGRNQAYAAARAEQIPVMRVGKRFLVLREPLERMLRGEVVQREVKAGD